MGPLLGLDKLAFVYEDMCWDALDGAPSDVEPLLELHLKGGEQEEASKFLLVGGSSTWWCRREQFVDGR